jgi:hypothetical protein
MPKEEERNDDGDGEESEQNRVFRRRLTILALAKVVEGVLPANPRAQ